MASMFSRIWEKLAGKRDEKRIRRPEAAKSRKTVKLLLEVLEDRTLLSVFTFTDLSGVNDNWSTPGNWAFYDAAKGKWTGATTTTPGVNDDVYLTSVPASLNLPAV